MRQRCPEPLHPNSTSYTQRAFLLSPLPTFHPSPGHHSHAPPLHMVLAQSSQISESAEILFLEQMAVFSSPGPLAALSVYLLAGQTQQPRSRNVCLNSSREKSMGIWLYISMVAATTSSTGLSSKPTALLKPNSTVTSSTQTISD